MKNPLLKFTILNPTHRSKTIFENRILDEYMHQVSWSDFVQTVLNPSYMTLIDDKDLRQLIIPVTWKSKNFDSVLDDGGHPVPRRTKDNIQDWYMLPVDIDDHLTIESAKEHFKEYAHLGYTTYNHSPEKHKFRILIPLKKPIDNLEFQNRLDAIKKFIGVADSASISQSQGFYLPSCNDGNKDHTQAWENPGKFLDLESFESNPQRQKRDHQPSTDQSVQSEQWSLPAEVDLTRYPAGLNYLKSFFVEHLTTVGHHTDCLRLHSILKSFNVPAEEHLEIIQSFKYLGSSHDGQRGYENADPNYGGMGALVNFLKDFSVLDDFSIHKFKVLTGQQSTESIKDDLKVMPAKLTETHVLGKPIDFEENGLVYEHKATMIGDIFSDQTFPLGISLLSSPTNSGKTYMFKKKLTSKRIIMLPTKALVDQVCNEDDEIAKCYNKMDFPVGESVIACTYDKMKMILSLIETGRIKKQEYDLFIDEAHNLYTSFSYRAKAMLTVYDGVMAQNFRKVVLMSGTIRPEYLPDLKLEKHIIVKRATPKIRKCTTVLTDEAEVFIKNEVSQDTLTLVLLNHKDRGQALADWLESPLIENSGVQVIQKEDGAVIEGDGTVLDHPGFKCQVFNSDNQQKFDNQQMLKEEVVKAGTHVLIFTSIGVEGLNLNNLNIKKVIAVGHHNSVALEQLLNRARVADPELLIVRPTGTKTDGYLQCIDIEECYKSALQFCDFANGVLSQFSEFDSHREKVNYLLNSVNQLPSYLSWTVRYHEGEQKFMLNSLGLASKIYETDGSNESYNSALFELHMSNYNFELESASFNPPVSMAKQFSEVVAQKKEKRLEEWQESFTRQITNTLTDPYKLRVAIDDLESSRMPKSELRTALELNLDSYINLRTLSWYYTYGDAAKIALSGIADPDLVEAAHQYGKDIHVGSWLRGKLQNSFNVGQTYFMDEVRLVVKKLTEQAPKEIRADLDGMQTDKGTHNVMQSHFKMKKERKRLNKGDQSKPTCYTILSHNPIGFDVQMTNKSTSDTDQLALYMAKFHPPASPMTNELLDLLNK